VVAAHNPVDFADPSGLAKTPLGEDKERAKPGMVQTVQETVITAEVPFEPAVSYKPALEAAQGRGHIEGGDVRQFLNGGYNGLVNILPLLLGPVIGPTAAKVEIKKAPIDPRYGGAAIVGEHLAENLALEAALAIPAALSMTKKIFTSRRLVSGLKAPVFLGAWCGRTWRGERRHGFGKGGGDRGVIRGPNAGAYRCIVG
jgi:hypothetical protein